MTPANITHPEPKIVRKSIPYQKSSRGTIEVVVAPDPWCLADLASGSVRLRSAIRTGVRGWVSPTGYHSEDVDHECDEPVETEVALLIAEPARCLTSDDWEQLQEFYGPADLLTCLKRLCEAEPKSLITGCDYEVRFNEIEWADGYLLAWYDVQPRY